MSVYYEEHDRRFVVLDKRSARVSAHIHNHFEFLLVTAGTLDLGIGHNLYHMEEGDFAVVFPDLVHYYRVPRGREKKRSIYVLADPNFAGSEFPLYAQQCPENPVICADRLHPDIPYAMNRLSAERRRQNLDDVRYAFSQLILARALPEYKMIDKSQIRSADLVYRTVEYLTMHFRENIMLADVARELGVSPYAISRLISSELHTNFNQYLNRLRSEYAANQLLYTEDSITDICYGSGFESQRTFNRAFKACMGMTPREYRKSRGAAADEETC